MNTARADAVCKRQASSPKELLAVADSEQLTLELEGPVQAHHHSRGSTGSDSKASTANTA